MNNSEPKFNGGNENNFNSSENNSGFGNNNFLNQNFSATPLTNPIKVPGSASDFKTKTNPPFNTSYISQTLGINGTETKPQHNKPIYQPIIYQPFVMPIMANSMNNMGIMPPYNAMMMGYPPMVPYSMGSQFPMMMGYPPMTQYPGMMTYPPMIGPDVNQQGSTISPQFGEQENNKHFGVANPNVMNSNNFSDGNNFGQTDLNFNQANDFGNYPSFSGQTDFGAGNSNFGPTPDFNAAPGFSSSPDFSPSDAFNNNNNMLGKINSNKMPFQYETETSKRKLPVWAIVLIIILVILVLTIVAVVMLYFNLEAVHNLINSWFKFEVPFNPWF